MAAPRRPKHLTDLLELIKDEHLRDLVRDFNSELRAADRQDRTIALYNQSLKFYIEWLIEEGRPVTLASFARRPIIAWMEYLTSQPIAKGNAAGRMRGPETVLTRHRGLRRFCRYLVHIQELDKAPTEGMTLPEPSDTAPMVLEIQQLKDLIAACKVPRGKASEFSRAIFDGRRDELIIRLLADCALRVSELTGLDIEDVDRDAEEITVRHAKGGKRRTRRVPYNAATGTALAAYLRVRRLHSRQAMTRTPDHDDPAGSPPRHPLLLGERGAMSTDGIRWRLNKIAKAAGINDLHPHALRHTFAHHWLLDGGNEHDLEKIMGWRGTDMVKVYGRSQAIKRAHAAHRRRAFGDRF